MIIYESSEHVPPNDRDEFVQQTDRAVPIPSLMILSQSACLARCL